MSSIHRKRLQYGIQVDRFRMVGKRLPWQRPAFRMCGLEVRYIVLAIMLVMVIDIVIVYFISRDRQSPIDINRSTLVVINLIDALLFVIIIILVLIIVTVMRVIFVTVCKIAAVIRRDVGLR